MAVGILVSKEDNVILDLFDGVVVVEPQKVTYIGGYVEGFDESKIGLIVTNDITVETVLFIEESEPEEIPSIKPNVFKNIFRDLNGDELKISDKLPNDLLDIKSQFLKPDPDQRVADLELMIAELMNN